MSRFKRLKERKRKNRIKAVSCGLALTLAVGLSQGLGTYALFMDTENVSGDLAISTGDVDVEVSEGKDFIDVQPGHKIEIPFVISNKGTLNQNVSLELDISNEIMKYLPYSIIFDNNITIEKGTLYNGTDLFVLSPGKTISGSINITVGNMNLEEQNSFYGKTQDIKLNVESTQINKDNTLFNGGFYDIETQLSTLIIGGANIIPSGSIKVSSNDTTIDINHYTNDSNGYIGLDKVIDKYDQVKNIEYIKGTGAFAESKGTSKNSTYQLYPVDVNTIPNNFNKEHTITLKFNYEDGSYKKYMLDFKAQGGHGNRKVEAQVWLIIPEEPPNSTNPNVEKPLEVEVIVPSEPEIVEQPKEEVEKPVEPGVVEPPKEEVEVPYEPEVVEPPKEEIELPVKPEVVEPPKQPESIEPPKENEAIQE